jgi:hypothetical protein
MGMGRWMLFIFTFIREFSHRVLMGGLTEMCRFNKGDIVLGVVWGDHVGDWLVISIQSGKAVS